MLAEQHKATIGFVWQPDDISPFLIQMARRTGSRAIFEFSGMTADELHYSLLKNDQVGHIRDIKISAHAFIDPSLGRLLAETGVQNIWIECAPRLSQGEVSGYLEKLKEISQTHCCFPIIRDMEILEAARKDGADLGRIVLKGCEASGFVSGETTTCLYSMVKQMLRTSSRTLDILIWGGVSTPEAAAAFLSTGVTGIVFESVHWLTDLVAIDDFQRRQLSELRLNSTDLVGLDLQAPCRLFNKGNSLAFKEIKRLEDSLCGAKIQEESRRSFVNHVQASAVHPLKSHFARGEVIPLGVEAAFAASFVERFGAGSEEAVKAFMGEIKNLCNLAEAKRNCFMDSPTAREMGIRYPFIQGAMSWITDVPEFALKVADAGGLPTIALGLMDADALEQRLGHLQEIMGERPYAVNVVSLMENPLREMHLAWIKKHKPRFAVIAGGDLSPIRELIECGINVIYIAPDMALLKIALEAGVRYVVCEGYEAGGHVGRHSTLTLAQRLLVLKRRAPALFQGCHVILAGGIFTRESAFMAAMLGADAIQMGTAYLATREIVETGALTELYQRMILKSPFGGTVVSGQGTELRVRSLKTPRVEAILSLEREFAAGHHDETSFRAKMEKMAAGSLFAAARGMNRPGESPLDERACLERGQFMSGACAGLIPEVQTLDSLHRELAGGPLLLHQPFVDSISEPAGISPCGVGRGMKRIASRQNEHDRIAITGMSILNALGKSPEEVWDASLAMKSGITLVPPSRWDAALFFNPRPQVPDKTYCKVGAFLDFDPSRSELGIPPHDFRTMTGATRTTMWLADRAIRASGILESDIDRQRIAVLISQNSGETAGTLTDITIRGYVHDILASVKRAIDLTPGQQNAIEQEIKSGRMAPDDTTLLGRINCAAAGFICNRYGFMGPSYAVSAACASSLVALHCAIQMIQSGIIDAAIVGGGEEKLTHMHFLEFSALGALYGLSGRERPAHETSRPFDAERDGMVLGEGGGMIVIEREGLARARGGLVHAFVTGMGACNNHLSMVESASATQEVAIGASFRGVPYGPDAVDLVECHATSTRQGDVEEVRALKAFFKSTGRTVITSFKSQIGHTLGASGINSLIRGVMAMKAGVLPATLNYRHPDPEIDLKGSGLLIAPEPLDWKARGSRPRRLQVNSFGFGGSNYVVQVEQAMDEVDTVLVSMAGGSGPNGEKGASLPTFEGVSFFRTEMAGRNCRMAVVAASEEEALRVIEGASPPAQAGGVFCDALKSLARQGILLGQEDTPAPSLAFVFPGQGAQYEGMGRELYESFPVVKEWMDRAAAAADFDLLRLLFHDKEENLQKTRWQQPAMFAMEHAMGRYLMSLGIHPVAMAGHSLGELTALCLAGVYSPEDGFGIVNKRAICMDKAAAMHVDPGVMAATDAPLGLLKEMIQGRDDIHIGNINSPNQIVLSGKTEAVRDFGKRLKEVGHRTTFLRVSMAFHSPIMKVIHDELEAYLAGIPFHPPKIPVLSNTTMALYPSDPDEIRLILMNHLESTVNWMNNVQSLWNDHGARLFLEIGPGEVLSDLIADTLPESKCIQTCLHSAEALTFKTALAGLFVQGHLKVEREARFVSLFESKKAPESHQAVPASAQPLPELGSAASRPLEAIIQREINRFMFDTFGRFLKPNILEAIHREFDPAFREDELSAIIKSRFEGSGPPESCWLVPPVKPVSPPPCSAPAMPGQASPAPGEAPEGQDLMERVVRIIMDATGFNRDEIQPDMDIRRDLSIRSSRLPVIMDGAERQFGITIELEDFIDVRTVRDIAQRISKVIVRQGGDGPRAAAKAVDPGLVPDETAKSPKDEASVKRLIFNLARVESAASLPVELSPGESVLLLSPHRDDRIAGSAGDILRLDYGVETLPMAFAQGNFSPDGEGHDIRTDEGVAKAANAMARLAPLSGMVISLGQGGAMKAYGVEDVLRLLKGMFLLLKSFLQSPVKKFVVLIQSREDSETPARLLAEGMLGLFLSAAQEYSSSVQFRTLEIDGGTDLRVALRGALDRGSAVVETIHRSGEVFTSKGYLAPSVFGDSSKLELSPGDVVVMSGGAAGISAHLARALVPFMPRLVFLGRTPLDQGAGPAEPRPAPSPSQGAAFDHRASEITQTLADLRSAGIEASYHVCDVTDPEAVRVTMAEVVSRYGRIDGIIHGAGVLRDGPLIRMTLDDFSAVTDVKVLGAWNLFSAARGAGLRFFVGLSSAGAIQGNPGQANYAAANRMMSALLRTLRRKNGATRFKAFMLPPVEGAGMADDPEVRELMKQKGVGYIHVNELAGLFCRELFLAPPEDDWVMFMRTLPLVGTSLLDHASGPSPSGELDGGAVSFHPASFPMIETISSLDLGREELEAYRTFSPEKDLWIADHRPFKSIKHPLVSAAMVVETFMEAARILFPHLQVRGVSRVRLMDMIQCPPGVPRPARISCRRSGNGLREVLCEASLETQELSPAGRLGDRFIPHCQGQVILDGGNGGKGYPIKGLADFSVRLDELRTKPMDHKKVLKWYKDRSGLEGRYRVMESLDGAGPGVVRGRTTYRETSDFANLPDARCQYSPYLFEALLQMAGFYIAATNPSERRSMIPVEIGEMRFLRKCRAGEQITLEARTLEREDEGLAWDARAIDDQGRDIMQISGMRMHWIS